MPCTFAFSSHKEEDATSTNVTQYQHKMWVGGYIWLQPAPSHLNSCQSFLHFTTTVSLIAIPSWGEVGLRRPRGLLAYEVPLEDTWPCEGGVVVNPESALWLPEDLCQCASTSKRAITSVCTSKQKQCSILWEEERPINCVSLASAGGKYFKKSAHI